MKKLVVTAIILLALGIGLLIASIANLSRFSAYLIGRAIESTATVGDTDLSFKDGNLFVKLSDIRFSGKAEGKVLDCRVTFKIFRGAYVEDIAISGFEISVDKTPGTGNPFKYLHPFNHPIRSISIRKGVLSIPGRKIVIDAIEAKNLNVNKTASINARISAEDLGAFHITGRGAYNQRVVDVKGSIDFKGMALARIYDALKGAANGSGTFALRKDRFDFVGKTEVGEFGLKEAWLKKPVNMDKAAADVNVSAVGESITIKIGNAFYKKTPFQIAIDLKNYRYLSLELSSDFIDVRDVTSYATSDYSLQELWDVLKGGQVKAVKLQHKKNGDITADLVMRNVSAIYNDMPFTDISGDVSLNNSRAQIVKLKGGYKKSRFYNARATIPYSDEKPISATGRYTVEMKDIPPIIDLKGITFESGTADGTADVQGKGGRVLQAKGSGTLKDARAIWKNISFMADGAFRFSDSKISFDPLRIRKDKTNIVSKATVDDNRLDVLVKGTFEARHLSNFVRLPFESGGTVELDGEFHVNDDKLRASGAVDMKNLIVNIPGYLKKDAGVKSGAFVNFSAQGPDIVVDGLAYNLENIEIRGRGTISDRKINASVEATAPDLTKVANLLLLPEDMTAGSISLDLSVKDLEFPVKRLPYMTGTIKVNNGFVRVPGLSNPLKDIDLAADFKGDSFAVQLNGLTCGASRLTRGTLTLNNPERPSISASIDMARFNPADFNPGNGAKFRILESNRDNIFSRSSGELILRSNETVLRNVTIRNVSARILFSNGMINIPSATMGLFGGEAAVSASLDPTGTSPKLSISGSISRLQSDLVLAALGSTAKDLTGTAFVNGNLTSEGRTTEELVSHLSGSISIYNRDGVIRKWNLLSKIFGALNFYDLLRGKVDFGRNGLPFNKLGAEFTGSKGVFHTDNFLLDSSSMVLTGQGDLNLNDRQVQGSVQVSPLIVIDRTLSKIPLLRDIVKEPNQGFLYVTYSIRGPIADPTVTPDVVGTIGGKAVEILRNILVFPREVFQ